MTLTPAMALLDWLACASRGAEEPAALAAARAADGLTGAVTWLGTAGHVLDCRGSAPLAVRTSDADGGLGGFQTPGESEIGKHHRQASLGVLGAGNRVLGHAMPDIQNLI